MHILLIDRHAVFRGALAVVLAQHLERPVIAQARTLAEGQRHLAGVDLVVVAPEQPDETAAALVRGLRGGSRQPQVVAVVPPSTPAATLAALEAAAAAVVSTGASLEELLGRLAQVGCGKSTVVPSP